MKNTPQLWKHQEVAIERAMASLPSYALFMEPGCLAHDTEIKVNRGGALRIYTIEELYRSFNKVELSEKNLGFNKNIPTKVRSFNGQYVVLNEITSVVRSGVKKIYKLQWAKHSYIKLTLDHKILTKRGFVAAKSLRIGEDFIAIDTLVKHQKKLNPTKSKKNYYNYRYVGKYHPYHCIKKRRGKKHTSALVHKLVFEAHLNKMSLEDFIEATYKPNNLKFIDPKLYHVHHKNGLHLDNRLENLELLSPKEHLKLHTKGYSNFEHGKVGWRKIQSLTYLGEGMTYDISCKAPHHNFVANSAIVHNSGKTATTINIIEKLYERMGFINTVIFAPSVVCSNWKDEIEKYGKGEYDIHVLLGASFKRTAKVKGSRGIFITNYEALQMRILMAALKEKIEQTGIIIFDESQKLKNPSGVRAQRAHALAKFARYRFILSGSPILNSPMDVFQQFKCMDLGETFGENFYVFRAKYFYDANAYMSRDVHFPKWTVRPGSMDEINRKIFSKSFHVKKSECLDLPPLIRKTITVQLSPMQRSHYDTMKKHFITYINDQACVASIALTKALRLQQICAGHMVMEDGKIVRIADNPRVDALSGLLELYTEASKVIVWAVFKEDYVSIRQVCEKLELPHVELTGETPMLERGDIVKKFNNDPEVKVLIGHPGAGGIGVTLTASNVSIFFSRNFSLENDIQATARNYRSGSEVHESVLRIDIVAEKTLDDFILKKLSQKMDMGESLLRQVAEQLSNG